MRVSHRWRWSPQGQADGGHRDTSHVLPKGPAPTHTHTHAGAAPHLTHVYSSIATHAVTKQGPHTGASQSGCPHR